MKRGTTLACALVMLFLFSICPMRVHAQGASITLYTTQGYSFSTVGFKLSGFHPRAWFGITFDTTGEAGGPYSIVPSFYLLNDSGEYDGTFQVLGAAPGTPVTVTVEASDFGLTYPETSYYATTYFTILPPSITLNPTSGPVGTTISITGHGFFPGDPVEVEFLDAIGKTYGIFTTVTADPNWDIRSSLNIVGWNVYPGVYTIQAVDSGSASYGTASFTVTAPAPSKVATPTLSPEGGSYSSFQNVVLSCGTDGATIRYTVDGSEPSASSTVYSSPISVGVTTTIKAKAFKNGMTDSDTASATYMIILQKVATPTLSPEGGSYSDAQSVTVSCATSGAIIRYSSNGSEPSSSSTVYSGSITVSSTTTIKAKAFKSGMTDSNTVSATYTITSTPSPFFGNWPIYAAAGVVIAAAIVGGVLHWRKRKKALP